MASVKAEVKKMQQETGDYHYDRKAEEEMKRRWEQLKNRKKNSSR